MKLTDQEQVILKAIDRVGRSGLASISEVIKAVGYPKATTKKLLISLSNKGAVSLHRHDYPASLKPEQRKLLVRIGRDYFSAVSMRKRNPKKKIQYARWEVVYITPLYVYVKYEPDIMDLAQAKKDAYSALGSEFGEVHVRQLIIKLKGDPVIVSTLPDNAMEVRGAKGWAWIARRGKNPSKGKAALKTAGKAVKGFAQGTLSAASQILGAGATALNPVRRKIKNKYIDLVIKGQAKKTPQGWKVGKKTFAQGRGTVSVSSGYYLDRATGLVYSKRERNKTKTKKRAKRKNVSEGFYDASGVFHPIRSSSDYSPTAAGETGRAPQRSKSKKKVAAKRKASQTARRKSGIRSRKATTRRLAGRSLKRTTSTGKRLKKRNPQAAYLIYRDGKGRGWDQRVVSIERARHLAKMGNAEVARDKRRGRAATGTYTPMTLEEYRKFPGARLKNPSAESIRKKFAGRVTGERDVYVPSSTPKGKLAKLGNLVLIQTEQGTIKPVRGSAVLLADTRGKLHIGTTSKSDLFNGPRQSFGEVKRIEYDSSKPHLGYPSPIIWHHKLGEESGHRPTLHADGQGGLVFRGGRYRLTRRGIEN